MAKVYDSVTYSDIPMDAEYVALYDDGSGAAPQDLGGHFTDLKVRLSITVFARDNIGDILDVENGDANPSDAPTWINERRNAGATWAAIYVNKNTLPLVQAAMERDGVTDVPYIVADWRSNAEQEPTIPEGAVGIQYANPDTSGGHYDLSLVDDTWLQSVGKEAPKPEPKPEPTPGPLAEVEVKVPVLSVNNPGPNVVSPAVKNLQTLLESHGISVGRGGVDGRYGNDTAQAVVVCEEKYHLTVDSGVAGEQVWTALTNE